LTQEANPMIETPFTDDELRELKGFESRGVIFEAMRRIGIDCPSCVTYLACLLANGIDPGVPSDA
jgi:hypothetical protein